MMWSGLREFGRSIGTRWRRLSGRLYDGGQASKPARWLASEDAIEGGRTAGGGVSGFVGVPRSRGRMRSFNDLVLRSPLRRSRLIAQLCGRLEPLPGAGPENGDSGVREPRNLPPDSGNASASLDQPEEPIPEPEPSPIRTAHTEIRPGTRL